MSKLKIELKGDGAIDNASIYMEDPAESIEYKLSPLSDTEWTTEVAIPVSGTLDFSLYVVAFSGTHFQCIIRNTETNATIEFEGITGTKVKNRAHIVGSQNFKQ